MPAPSPELLLSLSPPVLRSLLSTFGPLPDVRSTAPTRSLARAIFEGRIPPKLLRPLESILGRFGTEPGRRSLIEAAHALRDPRASAWLDEPAADIAAKLAIEIATTKGSARRTVERIRDLAALRLERELNERATYELLAPTPVDGKRIAARLARELGDVVVDTWTRDEPGGTLRFAVFVRAPSTSGLVLEGDEITARTERPVTVDLIRLDPGKMRVSFTLARPELLTAYARALDLPLRPSFTLRVLHDLTREQLAALKLPPGVTKVTVVAVRWRRPDGTRHEVRGFDALDPAHEGTAPRSGYIDRATLRVQFGERPIDVFFQLPHRLDISDMAFEGPAREVLAALGILAPGAMPDDARSLAPYEHGDWRWRSVAGDDGFERLLAEKRVVRVLLAHVSTREHRMHGAGYVVRDVPGDKGAQYALGEDRSLGARPVTAKDRIAWRLDLAPLEEGMRGDLGATRVGEPNGLKVIGILDLGVVVLASGKIRFFYAMATPSKGWEAALVRACGLGVTPVVLVPDGHAAPDAILAIGLDLEEQLGLKRIGRVLGKAAEALGVRGEVEPWRLCDEAVVVETKTSRVWVLGVLVGLTEKPYRLLEYLAQRAGHLTTTKEVGAYVSVSEYPDVVARRTKAELEKQLRAALEAAAVGCEIADRLVVVDGRKGYRLGVGVRVI